MKSRMYFKVNNKGKEEGIKKRKKFKSNNNGGYSERTS